LSHGVATRSIAFLPLRLFSTERTSDAGGGSPRDPAPPQKVRPEAEVLFAGLRCADRGDRGGVGRAEQMAVDVHRR
jgi:hypothetical protein